MKTMKNGKMNWEKKHVHRRIFRCILLVFFVSLFAFSQKASASNDANNIVESASQGAVSVDPTGQVRGYSAVLYDNTSGLPTSEANAIAETSDGFIWIGSYSGLIRYDGNTFERMENIEGLASVVSLYVDSKDRLWIGTNDAGLSVLEKGKIKRYGKKEGLKSLSIQSIVGGNDGNVYVATTQGMVYVDSNMNMIPIDEPQINKEYICEIYMGKDGITYGVTKSGAVFTMKGKSLIGYYGADQLGIPDVHSICPDPDNPGYIYLGTTGSELFYGKPTGNFRTSRHFNLGKLYYVNSIDIVDGNVWICTDSGIGFIKDGKYTILENLPMTTSVVNVKVDYLGNLWFISSQQGVMKIVQNQFTDVFDKYHLNDMVVNSTCLYNGKLFIGTKTSGIIVLNKGKVEKKVEIKKSYTLSGQEFEERDLIKLLENIRVRSIIRDSKNRLWISTFSEYGLIRYDKGIVTKFTRNDGMPSERIRTVYECKDGRILVCCTGGLVVINGNKIERVYKEESGISNTEILTVAEGKNGQIIVGTDGGGIYVISKDGVSHIGVEEGLSSEVVMRIKKDIKKDIYWIVTSNSIAYMDSNNKIKTINKFPYSNNFDLYENKNGKMWILSSNGIYVADVEKLLKNRDIAPLYYGMDNGLPCIATANSYSEITNDGELFIAGTTGVAKVNIDKNFDDVSDFKVSVPYVEVDGNRIYPDKNGKFVIPSNTEKLTIYSYVYNYTLMNPDVSYRLDNFEKTDSWVKRSEMVPVNYTNLRGGDYNFIIELHDPQGKSSKKVSVAISKVKAIYELFWFHLIYISIIIFIIIIIVRLYIRIRTKRFLKKENEQKQLIREIVESFAKVIDMKDKYTNGHSSRVAEYTAMLTRELGYKDDIVDKYYNIALLHDIGKIGIPSNILNKPGKLTDKEFNIIKSHSALGYNALKNISIMPELATGAGAHHERPDGKGYPRGLKGEDIPRVAQIIAVADTFDAMYSDRPYRKRMNFEKVVSIMKEVKGTQLEGDVVDAFLRLVEAGEFRDPDDDGGGTTLDIDNIHKKYENGE